MPIPKTPLVVTLARPTETDPDATVDVKVSVIHPDRLRAEQVAARIGGLPEMKAAPLTFTTLWCWAALKRTGQIDVDARTFLDDVCLGVEKDPDESAADVDPTQRAQGTDSP